MDSRKLWTLWVTPQTGGVRWRTTRYELKSGVIGTPVASELEEIVENIRIGDAICAKCQVVDVVDRPQDIEDEDAMSFFGGDEGDADSSQG